MRAERARIAGADTSWQLHCTEIGTREAHCRGAAATLSPHADLVKIENLGSLLALRELRLDNNGISKIEGLEQLTCLTWLGELRMGKKLAI